MRVPTRGKCRPVEPGRIIHVVAKRDTIKVGGGPQALNGRGGLVLGVVFRRLLMGSSVMSGAVEAERHD